MSVEPTGPALGQGAFASGRLWLRIAEGTAGAGPLAHQRPPGAQKGNMPGIDLACWVGEGDGDAWFGLVSQSREAFDTGSNIPSNPASASFATCSAVICAVTSCSSPSLAR
jgi:hypothetical protein